MLDYPDKFETAISPLPTDGLDAAAAQAAQELAGKGYEVRLGLTPEYAAAIGVMAQEPAIKDYCPRDSAERFANPEATERWLSKGRATFLLLKTAGDGLGLAGYGWAGRGTNPHAPGGQSTFALRIGQVAQGQGLATPFARLIVAGAAGLYGARDIWLETWQSNAGAVHIYNKLGARLVAEEPGQRPRPDGTTTPDNRLYMTLPDADE